MSDEKKHLAMLAVCLFLLPIYLWSSGLPQVSAIFMAFVFVAFGIERMKKGYQTFEREFSWLFRGVAYTFVINILWFSYMIIAGIETGPTFLFSVFYGYNACVILFFAYCFAAYGQKAFRVVARTTLFSVGFQVLASVAIGQTGARGEIFFNNPNQLGYYALLSATILALAAKAERKFVPLAIGGIIGCLYLAALSLSKAAMIGCLILIIFLGLIQPKRILPLAFLLGIVLVPSLQKSTLVERVEGRLSGLGADADDSVGGRGYDRIWKYPEYALLGAGEGGVAGRFDLAFVGEMHSSFGTILFSYGIPGTLFFGMFLFLTMYAIGLARSLYLLPSLFYGLTHMGLRFTLFWVVFAYALGLTKDFHPQVGQVFRLVRRPIRPDGSAREVVVARASLPTGPA